MKNCHTIYTVSFIHLDTLEVHVAWRVSVSTYQARKNFLQYLRKHDILHSGDHYRMSVVEGKQPLEFPDELFEASYVCVAR